MTQEPTTGSTFKPTDLRGILKYVPRFRGHVFVIALDGGIIHDDNFDNLLLDVAVLKSLHIEVILVYGISHPLQITADARGTAISDLHGFDAVDDATLNLAVEVATLTSHHLVAGLTRQGLKCAQSNAVRAVPVGIIRGRDHRHTGKVEKIDQPMLQALMREQIIPVISPIVYDREGRPLRVNSDHLATELAMSMNASKILFLTPAEGLVIDGKIRHQIACRELADLLRSSPSSLRKDLASKAEQAVKAIHAGVPRVHFVNGRIYEGLLNEIFSNEGIGSLIYGNDYQQIRKAVRRDARTIYNLTRQAIKKEELLHRTLGSIEKNIDQYYVFEIDEYPIACIALIFYPEEKLAEIGSLFVLPFNQNHGIGRKLVDFTCQEAEQQGATCLLALSTQSYSFFQTLGFEERDASILPAKRRETYLQSKRQSRIFARQLPSA